MTLRRLALLGLVGLISTFAIAAEENSSQQIFTITVTKPANVKDVQLRYFLTDAAGKHRSSTITQNNQRILIDPGQGVVVGNSFRAIAYAAGCSVVRISVDDLSASNREVQFQCEPVSSLKLQGSTDISGLNQRQLQVEALYRPAWASHFLEVPASAVSPFPVATAAVQSDGTFTIQIPDFSKDPLWPSLTYEADLMFFLADAHGQRLALLTPQSDLSSRENFLKVLPSYPPTINFTATALNSLAYSKASH